MTITVPVETGEELTIEVLEQDPERPCIVHPRVATHQLRTGGCPAHLICLPCADAVRRMLTDVEIRLGGSAIHWVCVLHHIEVVAPARQIRVLPIGGAL